MGPLLSRTEALALVLGRVVPLPAEDVPLPLSAGRVLAEPAIAAVDLPPFDASAMDGFALRADDAPGTLRRAGRSAAGRPSARRLERGEAMAIATGGVLPDGADAVAPIEDVLAGDGEVRVPAAVSRGAYVRPRAGDLAAGEVVVAAGVRLAAAHLGALAAAGVTSVRCRRAPRVTLAVTGSELRTPGEALGPGEIYDANGLILLTQVHSAGGEPALLPLVGDDPRLTREAVALGLGSDVLLTSGGVSVGEHDLVRQSEAELGVEEVFWRVALRPGRPLAFGVHGRTLVFGLPGNPVSSLVGFELFVRPALLALQGLADPLPPFRPGRIERAAPLERGRESLLRARLRVAAGAVLLEPLSGQESHMIARASAANALVLVPQGEGELAPGSPVSYLAL